MIRSFRDAEAKKLLNDQFSKRYQSIANAARRKLELLESALRLEDLMKTPGNRLELLQGDRKGHYSMRINDRMRVCFRWEDGAAWDVEIVDYH